MKVLRALALFSVFILGPLTASAQLIAYYPFDGNANDASGHGFTVTTNSALYTANGGYTGTGAQGGAYIFNGTSSYLEIAGLNINPAHYPQLTMGAWVFALSGTPIRQVISQDDGGLDRSLGIDSRGSLTGWTAFAGNGWLAGEPVTTGTWTFLALSLDQVAGTATLYVNDHSYTYANTGYGSGWNFTRIGMNPSFGEYFAGTIDEVFFFSTALNSTQVDTIRTQGVLTVVPEPSTLALTVLGLGVVAVMVRRRRVRV